MSLAGSLDLLPTALSLAHVQAPEGLDGVDLMPYLSGDRDALAHETLTWRVSGGAGFAIRHGAWKVVHDIAMDRAALHDLRVDPGEDDDVSGSHPEKLAELLALYEAWAETLETPRWIEGHTKNTTDERRKASEAGTRQYPMGWIAGPESSGS